VLAKAPGGEHWIETLARRGYRFVGPVTELRDGLPQGATSSSQLSNLPEQLTAFIGRERELVEIKRLLPTSRLLTVVGVGGIGKTRLALQVAAEAADAYRDGVWLIEFASTTDPFLVTALTAKMLGVQERAGTPTIDALRAHLKSRRLLLILDNCEHLRDACAALADSILRAAAEATIIATSREPLHVAGEQIYTVPALSLPDPMASAEAMGSSEAVQLFVERARKQQPAFQATGARASAVAQLCIHLDGIPLALELAAARVRSLTIEEMNARLKDRFKLLTDGTRSALPRQQTLRATLDWSYELLQEPEKKLFARLSVFAGGWTLEAAEAVGAACDPNETGVLDPLTHLVQKSLVIMEAEGARYQLLETVRQYALERLDEFGEADQARTRHLEFFVAFAEKAQSKIQGPEQGAWMLRFDVERENLVAAHRWCDRSVGGAELGFRLVYALRLYWFNRGSVELGYQLAEEALTRVGVAEGSLLRCRALGAAGLLAYWMGRSQEAQEYLEQSLSIAREIGDKGTVAAALRRLGEVTHAQGNFGGARAHLEESLMLAREFGDKNNLAWALNGLGELYRQDDDLQAAQGLYEQSLALLREQGSRYGIAIVLLNLAMVSIGSGVKDRARGFLREVLAVAEEIGSKPLGRHVVEVSAALAALCKEWERTARLFGAADAQLRTMGRSREPADEAFLTPVAVKAQEALGEARFTSADAAGRALSYEDAIEEARAWLEGAH